jgi:PAS domain S-box-containing protein
MKNKLKCILLVDDNEADNNYHKTIIEQLDIANTVQLTGNGIEALAFITKENQMFPELIFLDIDMPKMNGWEFLEALEKLERKEKTVVVMLTSSQDPESRKKAEQIKEVDDYLLKPLNEGSLMKIVEKHFPDNSDKEVKSKKIEILLVEDNPADAGIVDEYLQEIYGDAYSLTICDYMKKALELLNKRAFDLILLDLNLPDSNGLDSFNVIFKKVPDCPIIILTGLNDESVGIKAVKLGAQDFLIKNNINAGGLKHSITHSLERYQLLKALVEASKKLEHKTLDLLRKQEQFEEAQKMAHLGSWEWDIQGNTIAWSDELFRIFGLKPGQFTPTSGSALKYTHHDDIELVNKMTASAYKDKIHISIDYRITQPSGVNRIVHEEIEPITDMEGKPVKMYGTLLDITERVDRQAELQEQELAKRVAIAKDQFLAVMSHELRTPLNSIIGFTKILLRDSMTQKQREQLQAVKSSSDILLALINDILDLSKNESGKIRIEETGLRLKDLINTAVAGFELHFEEKKIKVAQQYDGSIPEILIKDPVRVEQIFINLLSNAIKFTTDGGVIDIQTKLLKKDEKNVNLEFIISDTGIGIPADKLETIFEPFSQASRDTGKKYGGTGLGLSIVKRLVELMGGTISVKSEVNQGTVFTFILPMKIGVPNDVPKEIKELLRSKELKDLGHLKILLAEDSTLNQLLIEEIMAGFGFEIDSAGNGKIAIGLLEKNDYDIILMDLMMPEMDGFEASTYIRKKMQPPQSIIPIIALTSDVSPKVVVKSSEAGMDDYISKPFNEVELLNKMSRLIKKSRNKKMIPDLVSEKIK